MRSFLSLVFGQHLSYHLVFGNQENLLITNKKGEQPIREVPLSHYDYIISRISEIDCDDLCHRDLSFSQKNTEKGEPHL